MIEHKIVDSEENGQERPAEEEDTVMEDAGTPPPRTPTLPPPPKLPTPPTPPPLDDTIPAPAPVTHLPLKGPQGFAFSPPLGNKPGGTGLGKRYSDPVQERARIQVAGGALKHKQAWKEELIRQC